MRGGGEGGSEGGREGAPQPRLVMGPQMRPDADGRGDHGRGEGGAIAAAKLVSQCPGRPRRGAGAGQMPELKPGVSDLLTAQ